MQLRINPILTILLFFAAPLLAQQTPPAPYTSATPFNAVRKWMPKRPVTLESDLVSGSLTAQEVLQATVYSDGLGREIQAVTRQHSPAGNDRVTATTYDAYGRPQFAYLPFTSNVATAGDAVNDGNFKLDAFQQQVSYYNNSLTGQPGETGASASSPNWAYSQNVYEASPLNRITTSYSAGLNWIGSQSSGTPHNRQHQVLVNTAADNVQMWNIAAAQGSLPTWTGAYTAGQLYKSIEVDEQGHQSIDYKDSYGQSVLRKVQNTAAADNGSGSVHSGWICTYYVYDDYGNLRFIIPPAVVSQIDGSWVVSQTLADEFCYRYEYDALNRMIIKKVPGTLPGSQGEQWMVYDARDRLVMMQDGNMRPSSQWLCHLYDAQDRQVMTGTITYAGTLSQLQTQVTAQTGSNATGTAAATGSSPSSVTQSTITLNTASQTGDYQALQTVTLDVGFSSADGAGFIAELAQPVALAAGAGVPVNNTPVPSGYTLTPIVATFYDNYNWLSGSNLPAVMDNTYTGNSTYFITGYNSAPNYALPLVQSNEILGKVTGQMIQILGSSGKYLYAVNFYDDHGNVIQSQSTNITGGRDITTKEYDWSGKILRTLTVHQKNGGYPTAQTHLVATTFNYDAQGRGLTIIKTVNSTINGTTVSTPPTTIVANQYNEAEQLKQKTLGNNMETLTYEYNVRGWLLGVNRAYAKSAAQTANYFGFDLGYDKGTIQDGSGTTIGSYAAPYYNGAVAGMLWKTKGDNQLRKYDYTHDAANRLQTADFNQQTGGAFNKTAGLDFSVGSLSYDNNSNIKSMSQNGWLLGGSQTIDNLSYYYLNTNNSNRLMNVIDNSPYNSSHPQSALGDFTYAGTKTATTTIDYSYDANGNVTSDVNRAISSITYNYLNLPQLVTMTAGKGTVQFVYDALGNKIQKIVSENNATLNYSGTNYTTNITTTTNYIGDCIYKTVAYSNLSLASLQYTDKLQSIAHEEGRVRALYNNASTPNIPSSLAFDYFLRDHLGNIRMVLTDESQQDTYPAATLESGAIGSEQLYYNITNDAAHVIATGPLGWWPSPSGTYQNNNGITNPGNPNPSDNSAYAYKLNGQTGDKFGLGIALKVMAGDKISIMGKSVWHNTGAAAGSFKVSSVLSTFLNAFAGTSTVVTGGHGAVTGTTLFNNTPTTSILSPMLDNTPGQSNPSTMPKAAINWILFNDQFVPVSIGTDLVSGTGDVMYSHSRLNMPMAANGYLYVYCSNESDIDVYFDNLQVVNTRGPIVEETHYYPFGMAMAGISDKAWNKLPNFNHYNGNELQTQEFNDGTGLNVYDFNARYYDQQLGRFMQVDPKGAAAGQEGLTPYQMSYNDPATFSDANGDCPICVAIIIGAVVGGFLGGVEADINHTSVWAGIGKGVLVGGAGGALSSALSGAFAAWGMVGSGIANGAITGTVTGGLDAALSGKNVLKGMLTGGITGGLMGGVSGVIGRLGMGNGSEATLGSVDDFDDPAVGSFVDDADLDAYINQNIGDVNAIDKTFSTNIHLATDDNIPKGFYLAGGYLRQDGAPISSVVLGDTETHGGWFSKFTSDIYISPGLKGRLSAGIPMAHNTIAHEIMHAWHWTMPISHGLFNNNYDKYTEQATSAYNIAYGKTYGMSQETMDLWRSRMTNDGFLPAYSWKKIPLINVGLSKN